MNTWQPIESAPKDGTEIIAVDNSALTPTPYVVCWKYNTWVVGGKTVCIFVDDEDIGVDVNDIFFLKPTHWMPLPEPVK